jgi:hypothetical protein
MADSKFSGTEQTTADNPISGKPWVQPRIKHLTEISGTANSGAVGDDGGGSPSGFS